MISIDKQSKTYKFYDFLSKVFAFRSVTPFFRGEIETFRDICTFARVTLLYIFFSLPIFILFFASIFFTIYSVIASIITLEPSPSTFIVVVIGGAVLALAGLVAGVIGIITLLDKATDSVSRNTFFTLVVESVSSKHNKFCKMLKVVDSSKDVKEEKE